VDAEIVLDQNDGLGVREVDVGQVFSSLASFSPSKNLLRTHDRQSLATKANH
jgi:hypothetical protein